MLLLKKITRSRIIVFGILLFFSFWFLLPSFLLTMRTMIHPNEVDVPLGFWLVSFIISFLFFLWSINGFVYYKKVLKSNFSQGGTFETIRSYCYVATSYLYLKPYTDTPYYMMKTNYTLITEKGKFNLPRELIYQFQGMDYMYELRVFHFNKGLGFGSHVVFEMKNLNVETINIEKNRLSSYLEKHNEDLSWNKLGFLSPSQEKIIKPRGESEWRLISFLNDTYNCYADIKFGEPVLVFNGDVYYYVDKQDYFLMPRYLYGRFYLYELKFEKKRKSYVHRYILGFEPLNEEELFSNILYGNIFRKLSQDKDYYIEITFNSYESMYCFILFLKNHVEISFPDETFEVWYVFDEEEYSDSLKVDLTSLENFTQSLLQPLEGKHYDERIVFSVFSFSYYHDKGYVRKSYIDGKGYWCHDMVFEGFPTQVEFFAIKRIEDGKIYLPSENKFLLVKEIAQLVEDCGGKYKFST